MDHEWERDERGGRWASPGRPMAWLPGSSSGFQASVTRRARKRQNKQGMEVHVRFVLNFRDPATGARRQLFFARRADALEARDALVASVRTGAYATESSALTVEAAVRHWLEAQRGRVKASTWASYSRGVRYITGPLINGNVVERRAWARGRLHCEATRLMPMLGKLRVAELTTGRIRTWHAELVAQVGAHTAHAARKFLRAVLALAAEDFAIRVPPMPLQLDRARHREKKRILTPEQVRILLKQAQLEEEGLFYAFPFLTGVRPSEQLGLIWEDVDLDGRVLSIRRMQEQDGTLSPMTKTLAGERFVPITPLLHRLLLRWREAYPARLSPDARVFVATGGARHASRLRGAKGGRPLTYANFRVTYWKPALARAGLPYVTPHSARHTVISVLQAAGVEVGLVSKLAGHANAAVTLQHYTQAVRGGEAAMQKLEAAYLSGV